MTSQLPPNWTALSDAYGRTYYHNQKTNQTTWTPPTVSGAPQAPTGYPGGLYPGAAPYSGPASGVGSNVNPAYGGNGAGVGGAVAAGSGAGYASAHTERKGHHGHGHGQHGGTAAAHTFSTPKTFILKEKVLSLSGDSFSIKDEGGHTQYKVEGKLISLRDKKVLCDKNGHKLYRMKESLISLRSRQQILDAKTGETVVTLRQKSFIPMMGTSTVLIWKGDGDHGEPWLRCKGNFLRKHFSITEVATGRDVCTVKRKSLNLANLLFEKDTYIAQVAAGVNAALMVFLVVSIDEVYRDDSSSHSSNTHLPSALANLF